MLGIIGKPLMKRGARAWFCGIPTYGGKVIEFQSLSMNKKIRKLLLLTFWPWQQHTGILVYTKSTKESKLLKEWYIISYT